jgi:hypothetical protein
MYCSSKPGLNLKGCEVMFVGVASRSMNDRMTPFIPEVIEVFPIVAPF